MKVARNASSCVCVSRQRGAVGADQLVLRSWHLPNGCFGQGLFSSGLILWSEFPYVVGAH